MPKKAISATIDEDLIKWISKKTEEDSKYRNKSHLIEVALNELKKNEKRGV
jgi:Arc/MetJ-type ribon-helix-helix transcriptional regulator